MLLPLTNFAHLSHFFNHLEPFDGLRECFYTGFRLGRTFFGRSQFEWAIPA